MYNNLLISNVPNTQLAQRTRKTALSPKFMCGPFCQMAVTELSTEVVSSAIRDTACNIPPATISSSVLLLSISSLTGYLVATRQDFRMPRSYIRPNILCFLRSLRNFKLHLDTALVLHSKCLLAIIDISETYCYDYIWG